MMFECPYCEEPVTSDFIKECVGSKEICPHCGKIYILRHSILNPIAYLIEEVTVDETDKKIFLNHRSLQ